MSDLNLKSDFRNASHAEWRSLVESGLRGGAFNSLLRETEDGLKRGPLMTAADLPKDLAQLARTELPKLDGRAWHVGAPVRGADLMHANKQLLENLKGGASAVRIENTESIKSRNCLKRVLEGVFTELVPIQFAPSHAISTHLELVLAMPSLSQAIVWAGLDITRDQGIIRLSLNDAPENWKLMRYSACDTHERGGTDAQELAILAAHIADAMRTYPPEAVSKHLVIDLAADRDTHLTIAKFRAARKITRCIAAAFDVDGSSIPICAVTSLRMMQNEDAWTNLLRVMSAGVGAVLGGADMVTTRPFTDGLGEATPFAHRIARNMQLMMMEESHLGQVADAAHGSYWHERMTEDLAQTAWKKFQMIEAAGGIRRYRSNGNDEQDIEASRTARDARAEPLLGVTLHPAVNVKLPEVRA